MRKRSIMSNFGLQDLSLSEFYNFLFSNNKIKLSGLALKKVKKSYLFLKKYSKEKVIYGINTGLGPMSQYKVDEDQYNILQENLIRSHAAGSGSIIDDLYVKASMIVRLHSLLKGYSGVHLDTVYLLAEFINKKIYPCIPEHGGVGASGDFVQLAHIALSLIGEGNVRFNNKVIPSKKALKVNKLKPLTFHIREGLALINGTSVMTGIGVVNIIYVKNLFNWCLIASSMIVEMVSGYDDFYSKELNSVKKHDGQRVVAEILQQILYNSNLIKKTS